MSSLWPAVKNVGQLIQLEKPRSLQREKRGEDSKTVKKKQGENKNKT